MKLSLFKRDLSFQLLAIYLFFVIPFVIAALLFDNLATQRIQEDIKAADLALARAIAEETNSTISNSLMTVQELGSYSAILSADSYQMERIFENVASARPDINLIYRLNENGIMLLHYPIGGPNSTLGNDFSFRGYFQSALTSRIPIVSLGRVSPTTSQPVATAVMPLWQDEIFLGLVATNIKLQSLSDTLESIVSGANPSESMEITIVDASGKVIAHPNQFELLADYTEDLPEVTTRVLAGLSGNMLLDDAEGNEQLLSFVPVPSANWGVIVRRPTNIAFATPRAFHQGVLIVVGLFLAIGFVFWNRLSVRIIKPIERLTKYSQSIGNLEGDQSKIKHRLENDSLREDQLGHLARSFQRMEVSIKARIDELSTLLETSTAVLSTLKTREVLENILEQVERLMDIDRCAIVAFDAASGAFRAKASRGLSADYAENLAIPVSEFHSVTMRAINSNKTIQISDTETDPSYKEFRQRARDEGYRSITSIPLKTFHAPQSSLVLYQSEPKAFTEREFALLSNFANHAAMAIENATLFERSDAALQTQSRRLESLIQSLEDGLVLEDLEGRILYINRRMSDYAGKHPDDLMGASVETLFSEILVNALEQEKAMKKVAEALKTGESSRIEIDLKRPSGTRHLRLRGFTVSDFSGLLIGRGQILRDVTKDYELDQMKSNLISTASHELRTPLAAIKGYASTLLAEDVDWDFNTQREFLEIISDESDRLSELVDNLLDISRIEAGNLTINRKVISLYELIENSINRCYPQPGERLKVHLPKENPTLFLDNPRIEVAIRNLLENAIKFTEAESPIMLSAEITDSDLLIKVSDKGFGIPLENQDDVFSSFFRLDNENTKNAPGAGLGLAICRGFVEAHQGEIWLEPQRIGTCIVFSIPLDMEDIENLDEKSHRSEMRELGNKKDLA